MSVEVRCWDAPGCHTASKGSICRYVSAVATWTPSPISDVCKPTSLAPCDWFLWPRPILAVVRIGILGGTFDPVHIGHLAVADAALKSGRLDRVLMMPAGDPWQKADREVTPAHHRLEMLRLAVADIPGLEVDDREVEREGPTFTVDTLQSFDPAHELFLILGADAALGIQTWHRASDLLGRAKVMVVPRSGLTSEDVSGVLTNFIYLDMEPVSTSATAIRQSLAGGEDVSGLVPEPVLEYISEHNLYTNSGNDDMVESPPNLEE